RGELARRPSTPDWRLPRQSARGAAAVAAGGAGLHRPGAASVAPASRRAGGLFPRLPRAGAPAAGDTGRPAVPYLYTTRCPWSNERFAAGGGGDGGPACIDWALCHRWIARLGRAGRRLSVVPSGPAYPRGRQVASAA